MDDGADKWLRDNKVRVIPYDKDYADEVYREYNYMGCAEGRVGYFSDMRELDKRRRRRRYGSDGV